MSRYYSKRNKAKVWRKTYGKKYIARRAIKILRLAQITSTAVTQSKLIASALSNNSIGKSFAQMGLMKAHCDAVALLNLNEGFVIKGK